MNESYSHRLDKPRCAGRPSMMYILNMYDAPVMAQRRSPIDLMRVSFRPWSWSSEAGIRSASGNHMVKIHLQNLKRWIVSRLIYMSRYTLFRVWGWGVAILFHRRYNFREAWERETEFFSSSSSKNKKTRSVKCHANRRASHAGERTVVEENVTPWEILETNWLRNAGER